MPKKYDKRKFRNAKEASVFETVEYQIKKGKLYLLNKSVSSSSEIKTVEDAQMFLISHYGMPKYTHMIDSGQIKSVHKELIFLGFKVKNRNRFSNHFKASRKKQYADENGRAIKYVVPGKYFLTYQYGPQSDQPIIINGKRLEFDTKGQATRFIHNVLALKDAQKPNVLSSNGIHGRLFGIKRDVFEVKKGNHSHIVQA